MKQIEPYDDNDTQPILLVNSGGCSLFRKVLHAQDAGAKMLIIVGENDITTDTVVDIDINEKEKIKIATVFIG